MAPTIRWGEAAFIASTMMVLQHVVVEKEKLTFRFETVDNSLTNSELVVFVEPGAPADWMKEQHDPTVIIGVPTAPPPAMMISSA